MKRHPALIPLSQDHHQVLVIAQRLRRATAETGEEATAGFLAHWQGHERHHFAIEEELLLPAYAGHGDPGHPAVTRMLQDHMLIRRDAHRLAARHGADPPAASAVPPLGLDDLHELGRRLADHVQLEEREVFPLIETTLPEAELVALGERLREAERAT